VAEFLLKATYIKLYLFCLDIYRQKRNSEIHFVYLIKIR